MTRICIIFLENSTFVSVKFKEEDCVTFIGVSNYRYPCPLSSWERWSLCNSHKGFLLP